MRAQRTEKFRRGKPALLALAATTLLASRPVEAADPYEDAPAYVKPLLPEVELTPIVTVGQMIPLTGGLPDDLFRVVGIPDGLGAYRRHGQDNDVLLLMNHEFAGTAGGPAGPLPSGSRVSEIILPKKGRDATSQVVSGRYSIEQVYEGDIPVPVAPGTKKISRFCSAFLATKKEVGFDRPIFLHGEESSGAATFDGLGGQAFADFEDSTYALPRIGRASWENIVALPDTKEKTVVIGLEDGPSSGDGLHSQVYMYVGDKVKHSADPLLENGLSNGQLYVLAARNPLVDSEAELNTRGQSTTVGWEYVDWTLNDAALDLASRAAGSFTFVRVEDGASDPKRKGVFYFATTGAKANVANPFGRLYRLDYDPKHPLADATLTVLLDGSEGVVSPDNIAVNRHGELALQEDPNYNLTTELGLNRDSLIWILDLRSGELTPIAEIDRAPAVAHALAANPGNSNTPGANVNGGWETSGIVDAEELYGRGAWLIDVQAHSLRIVPVGETVEGGQLLHLNYRRH